MAPCTTALEGKNEYPVAIESLDENFTLEKEYTNQHMQLWVVQ
jgi:hypothetical protein